MSLSRVSWLGRGCPGRTPHRPWEGPRPCSQSPVGTVSGEAAQSGSQGTSPGRWGLTQALRVLSTPLREVLFF